MPLFVQGSRQNLRLHARAAQRVHVRGKRSNLIVRELCPALRRHDARMLFRNRHALVDDFPDGSIASIPPQELISCEIGPKRCALAVRAMAADAGRVVVEAAPDGDLFSRKFLPQRRRREVVEEAGAHQPDSHLPPDEFPPEAWEGRARRVRESRSVPQRAPPGGVRRVVHHAPDRSAAVVRDVECSARTDGQPTRAVCGRPGLLHGTGEAICEDLE